MWNKSLFTFLFSVFTYGNGKLAQNVFNQFQLNDDPHNQRKMRASRSRARTKINFGIVSFTWHFVSQSRSCAAAFEAIQKIYHILFIKYPGIFVERVAGYVKVFAAECNLYLLLGIVYLRYI